MPDQSVDSKLVRIHSDAPANQDIAFGFEGYADALAGLIANPKNETPLVVGIYGSWGSGKTTLMKAIRDRLDDSKSDYFPSKFGVSKDNLRRCKTVWFQAWKYDKKNEILAGLLETIFQAMAKNDFFSQAKGEILKLAKGLDKLKILGFVSKLASGVDISDFFKELEYKKQLGFYDAFREFFDGLIRTYLTWRFEIPSAERLDDTCGALVIFIDDLDRCPQHHIVKVLETIKLFMDHKGCVFVIGAARDIITKALRDTYDDDAERFMEKIVQVTFSLPKVPEKMFKPFLGDLEGAQEEISQNLHLIMPAMGNNPRQLKRFVNNLNLRHGLMRSSGLSIGFDSVLLWGIIEHAFPLLVRDIEDHPSNLFTIKDHFESIADKLEHRRFWEVDEQLLKDLNVGQSLHKYILNESIVKILENFDIEKAAFNELLTYSCSVKSDEAVSKTSKEQMRIVKPTDTMMLIPAGPFKFGETQDDAVIKKQYWVDIYLITNSRYRVFLEDGGYETEKWWTETGWQWRGKNRILRPGQWDDSDFNRDDHPVVGVSWHEATAFCTWLSEISKDGFRYHLPTEKQWERAARGTDGRICPWGNQFDQQRCNTIESGKGGTTRVDLYSDGLSPNGCYDMLGNVWELTTGFFSDAQNTYVIKGGSWAGPAEDARCASRASYYPDYRSYDVGFRCAKTLKCPSH